MHPQGEAKMRQDKPGPVRPGTLLLALLASATLVAPASALAHKHPSRHGRCAVNINLAPHQIAAGDSVVVFGRLRCLGAGASAGRSVQLLQSSAASPAFSVVQSTSTEAHGFYELTVAGVQSNSVFYVRSHGASSGRRDVRVAAQVTLAGPPEGAQLLTGHSNSVTFTGTVNPANAGADVVLQRQNALTGNEWHRIDRGTVKADGSFSILHTFVVPGDANLRVLVRSEHRNIPSTSGLLTYEISQSQNPQLTIAASTDPIAFGQSVTISGTGAGVAGMPLTLLSRTAAQHGFAAVAEVTAGPDGSYTFPAQLPVNSTLYQVQAAHHLRSAVLYEGVRDVLGAAVSPSTVQAGQALRFSGTVAPDHSGHVIYLERKNASGTGFHIVQVATVGPGSSYSIAHTVYDTGTKVFRVSIPGGPENEGLSSPPLTVTVTPAPLAALLPEAPGNSSEPSEGQS
jgi:hypothetical protein